MDKRIGHDIIFNFIVSFLLTVVLGVFSYLSYYYAREFGYILVFALIAVVFGVLSIYNLLKMIIDINKKYDSSILIERLDRNEIIKKNTENKEKFILKTKKITKYILYVMPIAVGLLVIIGTLLENVVLSIVLPGFTLALFFAYYLIKEFMVTFYAVDDEYYLLKKETCYITNKFIYIYGKTYVYNFLVFNIKKIDDKFYWCIFKLRFSKLRTNTLSENFIKSLEERMSLKENKKKEDSNEVSN